MLKSRAYVRGKLQSVTDPKCLFAQDEGVLDAIPTIRGGFIG